MAEPSIWTVQLNDRACFLFTWCTVFLPTLFIARGTVLVSRKYPSCAFSVYCTLCDTNSAKEIGANKYFHLSLCVGTLPC